MEAKRERQSADTDEETISSIESAAHTLLVPGAQARVYLGSPSPKTSISEILEVHKGDRAFDNFRRKFTDYVNTCVPTYLGNTVQFERWMTFEPTYQVTHSNP